jgi:hypothetical protein
MIIPQNNNDTIPEKSRALDNRYEEYACNKTIHVSKLGYKSNLVYFKIKAHMRPDTTPINSDPEKMAIKETRAPNKSPIVRVG